MNQNNVIYFPQIIGLNYVCLLLHHNLTFLFLSFEMSDALAGFVVTRLSIRVKAHLNLMLLTQDDPSVISNLHVKPKMFRW